MPRTARRWSALSQNASADFGGENRRSAIAQLYERALVIVRPDGHVAWRADTMHQDPLSLADRVRGASE